MSEKPRRTRRRWSLDEKRLIVAQTLVAGSSVSRVARRYDVNANMVFKWIRDPRFNVGCDEPDFLPVEVSPGVMPSVCSRPDNRCRIKISLANGHRLEIDGGFDTEAIILLARGLSG